MNIDYQWVEQDVVYRYSRNAGPDSRTVDDHENFKYALRPRRSEQSILQLERGISASKEVMAAGSARRPVVLLRSSPWKAGTESTPWHDEYDMESGRIRYFGDSKPSKAGKIRTAVGNKILLTLAPLYRSEARSERELAPPIAVFRGEPGEIVGKGRVEKGFVRFIGIGLLAGYAPVRQLNARGSAFDNVVFNIRLCPLEETGGRVDWAWVNDRRDETIPAGVANLRAPYSWRYWIETGELPDWPSMSTPVDPRPSPSATHEPPGGRAGTPPTNRRSRLGTD